jgi:serine protease
VTGTIAQVTDNGVGVSGIARNVQIMPLKVLSAARGSGSVAGIADAIRYAADQGAKVINMSLGGAFPSRVLKKAVRVRARQGRGRGVRRRQRRAQGQGRLSGRVTRARSRWRRRSSTRATTFYSNWGKDVDVAAPGGNTRVDQNGDGMPDGVLPEHRRCIGDYDEGRLPRVHGHVDGRRRTWPAWPRWWWARA